MPSAKSIRHQAAINWQATKLIWSALSDHELLRTPIKNLDLKFSGSICERLAMQLNEELKHKELSLNLCFYIADEWFTPDDSGYIAFPFYLLHKRLIALERKMVGGVEGEYWDDAMRILRHEAGHCFDHAYRVSASPTWKKLFGDRTKPYQPDEYSFDPNSRAHVRNLDDYYAQAHPDEDFAETFAVWLNPAVNWRREYRSWPLALSKLEYVESVAKKFANTKPRYACNRPMSVASKLKSTLAAHYSRRIKRAAHSL